MTEFQELIQDAPNFVSMERGELVAYAYGMFAAGTKADVENAKLRKYVAWLEKWALDHAGFGLGAEVQFELDMARRELGVEVDE